MAILGRVYLLVAFFLTLIKSLICDFFLFIDFFLQKAIFLCVIYYCSKDMECIFCKIISGEISSVKVWENDQFVAILDVFPACKGQMLVIPKHHYDSDIFLMDNEIYSGLMLASKEVVELMKK